MKTTDSDSVKPDFTEMRYKSYQNFWWEDYAVCSDEVGESYFFPDSFKSKASTAQLKAAREICAQCAVRVQCFDEDMDSEGFCDGIRYGLMPADRAALVKFSNNDLRIQYRQALMQEEPLEDMRSIAVNIERRRK